MRLMKWYQAECEDLWIKPYCVISLAKARRDPCKHLLRSMRLVLTFLYIQKINRPSRKVMTQNEETTSHYEHQNIFTHQSNHVRDFSLYSKVWLSTKTKTHEKIHIWHTLLLKPEHILTPFTTSYLFPQNFY